MFKISNLRPHMRFSHVCLACILLFLQAPNVRAEGGELSVDLRPAFTRLLGGDYSRQGIVGGEVNGAWHWQFGTILQYGLSNNVFAGIGIVRSMKVEQTLEGVTIDDWHGDLQLERDGWAVPVSAGYLLNRGSRLRGVLEISAGPSWTRAGEISLTIQDPNTGGVQHLPATLKDAKWVIGVLVEARAKAEWRMFDSYGVALGPVVGWQQNADGSQWHVGIAVEPKIFVGLGPRIW